MYIPGKEKERNMSKDSRSGYLMKNTALFAIGNMGTKLINFLMVPLYTYALSTEQYGTINTAISICSIIIPVVMCNIGEAVRRYLLEKESDKQAIQTIELLWFAFGTGVSILMFLVLRCVPGWSTYALEMSLYTLTNAFVSTSLDYLRGKEKLQIYTFCGILQTFLVALLNVLFIVKFGFGVRGYFWSYIISYSVCGILAFICGEQLKDMKKLHFDKRLFAEMSKFSLTLVPNSIMWWITDSSDRLMVTYMISPAVNGIYSVAYKIPTIMSTMNTILMQAWQHSAIRENESEDRVEYNNKMFRSYMAGIFIVGAVLLFVNRPFMHLYVAPEYRSAWKYSPFLIVSSIFSTMGTFIGTSYYVQKDMKGNLCSATVGAICNVCLNLLFIPLIGAAGAAIATCISYMVVFVYRAKDTQKYLPLDVFSPLLKKQVVVIGYMLGCSYIEGILGYCLLAVGVSIILFLNKEFVSAIISKILKKVKK